MTAEPMFDKYLQVEGQSLGRQVVPQFRSAAQMINPILPIPGSDGILVGCVWFL
jgi:hypothetical protein